MTPEIVNGSFAVGGAIIGALVSGAVSAIMQKRNKEKRILKVILSPAKPLMNVDKGLEKELKITYYGHEIKMLTQIQYTFANTGNTALSNVELVVDFGADCEIIGGNTPQKNFTTRESDEVYVSWQDLGKLSLTANFLNAGESLSGHVLLTKIPSKMDVKYREPNVTLSVIENYDDSRSQVFTEAVHEYAKSRFFMDLYLKLFSPSYRAIRKLESE